MKIGLVGSTGGHFADLRDISQLLTKHEFFFVSFFAPNLTSFSEAPIFFVRDASKSIFHLVFCFFQSFWVFLQQKPDVIISSGAGVSLPIVMIAKLFRRKVIHIELVCQVDKLSKTGFFMKHLADIFIVQSATLKDSYPDFQFVDPLAGFEVSKIHRPTGRATRLLVCIGTAPEPFTRLLDCVDRLAEWKPGEFEVFVQYGYSPEPCVDGCAFVSGSEMRRRYEWADVLITHAGSGTVVDGLKHGLFPILCPRLVKLGEHTDPSQPSFAGMVERKGLCLVMYGDDEKALWELVVYASKKSISNKFLDRNPLAEAVVYQLERLNSAKV